MNEQTINNQEQETTKNQHNQTESSPVESAAEAAINYQDLYIKLAADFQNFRRRMDKERLEWTETAQGMILAVFFPIIEDFDRALQIIDQHQQEPGAAKESYVEGLVLIQKNMKKILADLGVCEIDTIGEFNPEYHEALAQIVSPDHKSGHIVQVFNKGYMFKGKVIKHAQVSVAQ